MNRVSVAEPRVQLMSRTTLPIFKNQWIHALGLLVLLTGVFIVWAKLGQPQPVAFWVAVGVPIVHQLFVWLVWRLELQSKTVSRSIGFAGYLIIFFVLFFGRFASLFVLGWLDRDSLDLPLLPRIIISGLLVLISGYAGYSVGRYFGMARAAGADHFDSAYREMPMVKQGIFRFTSNGMYVYAFLAFWAIAIACNSSAALAVAGFSHAYIWIHFFATEKPDMEFIYGRKSNQQS